MNAGADSRDETPGRTESRYGLTKRVGPIPEARWDRFGAPEASPPATRSDASVAKNGPGAFTRLMMPLIAFLYWGRRLFEYGDATALRGFEATTDEERLKRAECCALVKQIQRELRRRGASLGTVMAWQHFLGKVCDPDNLLSLEERARFLNSAYSQIMGKAAKVRLETPQLRPITSRVFTVLADRLHLVATRLRALSLVYHKDQEQTDEAKNRMWDQILERFQQSARATDMSLPAGIELWEMMERHAEEGVIVNLTETACLLERLIEEKTAAEHQAVPSEKAEIRDLMGRVHQLIDTATPAHMRRWYKFREYLHEAPTLNHREKVIVLSTIVDSLESAEQAGAERLRSWWREAGRRLLGLKKEEAAAGIDRVFEEMTDLLEWSILVATTAEILFTVIDGAAHAPVPQSDRTRWTDPHAEARRALREENKEKWSEFLERFNAIAEQDLISIPVRIEVFESILDKVSARRITSFAGLNSDRKINALIRDWRQAQARRAREELLKVAGIKRPAIGL